MKIKIITLFSLGLLNIGSSNVPLQNNNSIATAHPLASEAGNKMYTLGGNAADAAVAAGFTLAVVEPSMSGIGGRLQAIIKNDKEETIGIDASTEVPASYINDSKESNGYKTIGIPGVVAGLLEIHEKYGSLPLSVVMEPAISHAEKGFYLLEGEKLRQSFAKTAIANYNGTAHHFITLNIPNDKFIQKDLSNTLKRIKDKGSAGFYSGITAQRIVHDMQINGGFVTLQDLKNYKVKKSKVLKTQYKGFDIETLFLPSYGAITINILNILNNFNLNELSELNEVIITANAIKIGYSKRAYQQNPDSLENILSKMEGLKSANKIKKGYQSNYTLSENDPKMWSEKLGHTSHLTTADKNGMVVSLTQTIGPLMGSKVATKGLGFLYAVTMGGYLGDYKPGDRANSHISPTLISKNNKTILALGAAGGNRIVTAIVQVIKNSLDHKVGIHESIAKGRIFPENDTLIIENHEGIRWEMSTLEGLKLLKYNYKLQNEKAYHGRINAIILDTISNNWIGSSDPDWEGKAIENN